MLPFCPQKPSASERYERLIRYMAQRRQALGISSRELDLHIGCAHGLVSKWECGMRKPSAWNFACWMDALDVDVELTPQP